MEEHYIKTNEIVMSETQVEESAEEMDPDDPAFTFGKLL